MIHGFAPGNLLFNRYRYIRELGRGGMGVVLLAQDNVLDIPVAMKVPPEQIMHDTEGLRDLKKEVLRGMALTHSGIVRIYSFEHSADLGAIVMEYVDGPTMTDLKIKEPEGCFDCEQIRQWLEQLCALLDYAHQEARIAHRDLKPRNILVTAAGTVKVTDFGISSSLSDSVSRISVRADRTGTPPYMSPQQAMGERPTHLDDIYSLGATLYDLLTGRPPFFRGNIVAQVLEHMPPKMEDRRAEMGINGKAPIPENWERLVAACLAKDPAVRPQNGKALLELLDQKTAKAAPPAKSPGRMLSPMEHGPSVEPALHPPLKLPKRIAQQVAYITPYPIRYRWQKMRNSAGESQRWGVLLATAMLAGVLAAGALEKLRHWNSKSPGKQTTAAPAKAGTPAPFVPTGIGEDRLGSPRLGTARGVEQDGRPGDHHAKSPGSP